MILLAVMCRALGLSHLLVVHLYRVLAQKQLSHQMQHSLTLLFQAFSLALEALAVIGIRSIEIHYLDNELAEQTEIISLTGASLVNSVATDIRFINDMHVYTFGSGSSPGIGRGHAQGNITAEYQGTVYAKIGINQRLQKSSARMVPKGKKLFVADTTVGSTSGTADARCTFTLVANKYNSKLFDNPFLFIPINAMSTQDNSVLFTLPVPLEFPEGTVVAFEFSRDKTCSVEAAFHGWIEDV